MVAFKGTKIEWDSHPPVCQICTKAVCVIPACESCSIGEYDPDAGLTERGKEIKGILMEMCGW